MNTMLKLTPKGIATRWGVGTVSNNIIEHCLQNSASAAEEYIKAGQYLVGALGLEPVYVAEFDYAAHSDWAPKDCPLLKEAQSRAGGLNAGRAKDYRDRFDKGETIKNPPIHFWTGTETITAIGHTRTSGKRSSTNSVGPAIFVDVSDKSPMAQRAIILQTATWGNKETKDDKNLDSMEDAASQSKAYWDIVMELDPVADASEVSLQGHLALRSACEACETDEAKEASREEWHTSWMAKEFKYSFLRSTERTKIYKLAFTEELYSPLKEDQWTPEEKSEVYESFWPNNEWDPSKWSVKEDATSPVHQFEVGFATHERNHRRIIEDLEWSRKISDGYNVEVMIFGNPKVMLPETREKKVESHLKTLTALNVHKKRSAWGLPLYSKVLFLQGLITEDDSSYAYEWNAQNQEFDKIQRGEK